MLIGENMKIDRKFMSLNIGKLISKVKANTRD